MKTAIVTGCSRGIGLAIVQQLIGMNYRVYGLARSVREMDFSHPNFYPQACDVRDIAALEAVAGELQQRESSIDVLINNAGVGYFGQHEDISPAKLQEMVQVNLLAPLVLTKLLLKSIKKSRGMIINISSASSLKPAVFGGAYGATKAALQHFSVSLFEEIRKTGAKVVTLTPDITQTSFYDKLFFRPGETPETYLTPQCIAQAVETLLSQREGNVITQMVLQPQRHSITKRRKE